MTARVLPMLGMRASLHPLTDYLYIGRAAHRKLATLQAAGHLRPAAAIFDGSQLTHQRELLEAFRASGAEIVLDTKVAELAALGKYMGAARDAPWASVGNGQPLGPEHFAADAASDVIGQIARCAVENQFDTVLAPSHFLKEGSASPWLRVDRDSCQQLRTALDREGGAEIGIDYPLLVPHVALLKDGERGALASTLIDLPFDNLFIRASGFGADGAPSTTRRYIQALTRLHNLGKPVVADHVGGLVGLSTLAFGAAAGIAHGLGELQRFTAHNWHKPPKPRKKGKVFGPPVRISIPGMDKTLPVRELELLRSARGGHRLIACPDRNCCPHGLESMLDNPRRHLAIQWHQRLKELDRVPDLRREQYLIEVPLREAHRKARYMARLRVGDEALSNALERYRERLGSLSDALEYLHEERGPNAPRSATVIRHRREAAANRPERHS